MFEAEKIIHVCAFVYGRVMGALNKSNITSKVIVPLLMAKGGWWRRNSKIDCESMSSDEEKCEQWWTTF
jgi:hypothetical protein